MSSSYCSAEFVMNNLSYEERYMYIIIIYRFILPLNFLVRVYAPSRLFHLFWTE